MRLPYGSVPQKKTPFPVPGREFVYFQGPGRAAVPGRSNLLDEERHTGRRRPVAGPIDRNDSDRVIARVGHVYDGSITGGGMVQNAIQVDLIHDGRLSSLVVEGLPPEYIQFQTTDIPTATAAGRGGRLASVALTAGVVTVRTLLGAAMFPPYRSLAWTVIW